jgi:hypothetical protein
MSVKIGDLLAITKDASVQFTVQQYAGGSIGIRGSVQQGELLESTEAALYHLRDGSTHEVEIQTDAGVTLSGSYKINELNWKKERKENGSYELLFNIGLQKGPV